MTKNIKKLKNEEKTIDATGRSFGRVATEAANILRGKDSPDFERNRITGMKVNIINASSVHISTRSKLTNKEYVRYSGYPGGQKKESLKKLLERRGYKEVFKKAVRGMLPSNKLRPELMKRLNVSD
jgi:large subunit ribosomal protein L13